MVDEVGTTGVSSAQGGRLLFIEIFVARSNIVVFFLLGGLMLKSCGLLVFLVFTLTACAEGAHRIAAPMFHAGVSYDAEVASANSGNVIYSQELMIRNYAVVQELVPSTKFVRSFKLDSGSILYPAYNKFGEKFYCILDIHPDGGLGGDTKRACFFDYENDGKFDALYWKNELSNDDVVTGGQISFLLDMKHPDNHLTYSIGDEAKLEDQRFEVKYAPIKKVLGYEYRLLFGISFGQDIFYRLGSVSIDRDIEQPLSINAGGVDIIVHSADEETISYHITKGIEEGSELLIDVNFNIDRIIY